MGLSILASWRPPHAGVVVIMAPALTEPGQTEDFAKTYLDGCDENLTVKHFLLTQTKNTPIYIKSASAGGGVCHAVTAALSPRRTNDAAGWRFLCGGGGGDEKEPPCLRAVVTPRKAGGISPPRMNHCALPLPMADANHENYDTTSADEESKLNQQCVGGGNSANGTMGLPKSLSQNSQGTDMDILLNLTTTRPPNVDELMQVINSLEGDGTAEPVEFPLSSTDLSQFDANLLDDDDVMMTHLVVEEEEEPISQEDPDASAKESLIRAKHDDSTRKQYELERRRERLLRRLRKVQARLVGKHVADELTGVLERMRGDANSGDMCNFVEKLAQCAATGVRARPAVRYFGSGSAASCSATTSAAECVGVLSQQPQTSVLSRLSDECRVEIRETTRQLATQLRLAQTQLDSDATASSSGGESCDEAITYNNSHQTQVSIGKRAVWRWLQERAVIASRWSWLSSQVNELDFKIKQQTELHKKLKQSRGPLQLGPLDSAVSRLPSCNGSSISGVNGYHNNTPNNKIPAVTAGGSSSLQPPSSPTSCCRTRPLIRNAFRKRTLHRTQGLHLQSKRAARASEMRCWCGGSGADVDPCVICTGRTDPTLVSGWPAPPATSPAERVATIDYGYHAVLSLRHEVSVGVHLDAVMRWPEWQTRANRNPKYLKPSGYGNKEKHLTSEPKKLQKMRKNALVQLSAKIKKKLKSRHRKRRAMMYANRLNQLPHLKVKKPKKSCSGGDSEDDLYVLPENVPTPERATSPSTTTTTERRSYHRSLDDDSYDINNIVIPYSMAASTRVEMLPYKEILTPKWRVVSSTAGDTTIGVNGGSGAEEEDVSDEMVAERHARCEEAERRRFMSFIKLPLGHRGRRRVDSRADSCSGPNTPDPTSPLCAADPQQQSETTTVLDASAASSAASAVDTTAMWTRRRTISAGSKVTAVSGAKEGAVLPANLPDTASIGDLTDVEVAPYEPRAYPLSDAEYQEMLSLMPADHAQLMSFQYVNKPVAHLKEDDGVSVPESPGCSSRTMSAEDEESRGCPPDDEEPMDFDEDEEEDEEDEEECEEEDDEDPNDPEWQATVEDEEEEQQQQLHHRPHNNHHHQHRIAR